MEEAGQALVWLPGSIGSHGINPDLGRTVAARGSRGGGAWRAESKQVGQQCATWLAAAHGVVVRCWAPLASLEAWHGGGASVLLLGVGSSGQGDGEPRCTGRNLVLSLTVPAMA
jgi:hypothetical protein